MSDQSFEFELHNAGAGRGPLTAADLAADHDHVVAVLLRNHYCPQCRALVRDLADRYGAFATRGVAVVPVLPDIRERAVVWHRRYDLPFPMVADPGDGGEGFETFAPFQRTIPELPGAVVFECDGRRLRTVSRHGCHGSGTDSLIDRLLERLDRYRDDRPVEPLAGVEADG